MSSIANANGFFWQTLWKLPENAALKAKRKNPYVLMAGDIVHIPDLTIKQVSGATEVTHKFILKGVPEKLRLRLLDSAHKPRANLDYIIVIDGDARRGKTDGDGRIKESIPPGAREGYLKLGKDGSEVVNLKLGHLDPITEVTGVKARLANLGFYKGHIDADLDDAAQQAIRDFQTKQGLPVTGASDGATQQKLLQVHGN
jgi:N-acetylmuramoyl-L-alanine amidase